MTQVKTGLPPQFGGEGGSKDLKDIIPAVASGVGIEDIGKAVSFFKKHRGAIMAVLGLFGIGKKKEAKPVDNTPPSPGTPSSPGLPPSPGTPGASEPTPKRQVAALRARYFLIERKNKPGEFGGGRHILGKAEFDEIVSGGGYLRTGDRVHVDITPVDQFGVAFVPGGEENKLLLRDPNGDPNDSRNHLIFHSVSGADLTSEYDDYGCTPVLTVPVDAAPVDSDETWQVRYSADFPGVESVSLPPLTVKA